MNAKYFPCFSWHKLFVAGGLALVCAGCVTTQYNGGPPVPPDAGQNITRTFRKQQNGTLIETATQYWKTGDVAACERILNQVLEGNPHSLPANMLMAELNLLRQQPDKSVPEIQRLATMNPRDAELQHMLALLLDASGRHEKALQHYQLAVKLDPESDMFRKSLASAQLAGHPTDRVAAKPKAAPTPEMTAENRYAPDEELYDSQVRGVDKMYLDKPVAIPGMPGHEPSEQVAQGPVLEPAPKAVRLVSAVEEVAVDEGEPDMVALPQSHDSPSFTPARAAAQAAEVEPQQVEPQVAAAPKSVDAPVLKVSLNGSEPQTAADESEESDSDMLDLGHRDRQVSVLKFASASDAKATRVTGPVYLQRAREAYAAGRTDDGEAALLDAADVSGDDEETASTAALLALQHNAPAVSIEIVELALAQKTESARLYRIQGTAAYRMGDYPTAEEALQRALSLDNTSALAYFLMGSTLQKVGKPEAAERCFRQARHLDPSFAGQ